MSWRSSCPDENLVAAFADGTLDAASRRKLEAHVTDCARCLDQLVFLARAPDVGSPVPGELLRRARQERSRPRFPSYGAVAAAATLALGLGWYGLWSREIPSDRAVEVRDLPSAETPGPMVTMPSAGATVSTDELRVSWEASAGALDYSVTVLTESGERVFQTSVDGLSWEPAPGVRWAPGRYFLWVRAHLANGRAERSELVPFTLVAPP